MIQKARCRKCDHLFLLDEDRYANRNHVITCKQCGGLLRGWFRCASPACGKEIAMMNKIVPELCLFCGTPYTAAVKEAI